MKFDALKVDLLLDEMESILGRVRKISNDFQKALAEKAVKSDPVKKAA